MVQQYKHLLHNEIKIWNRFIKRFGHEYDHFEYDVHVGKLPPDLKDQPDRWRKAAESVYLKRIDVIGFKVDTIEIIEIKPHAGLGAIGQVTGYLVLYDDEHKPKKLLLGHIVTDRTDINTAQVAAEANITMTAVGEDVLL